MSDSGGGDGRRPRGLPDATYRIQFSGKFTFDDAAAIVDYLDALGISHLYASPYLEARSGSTHGYDITDHNAFNPELGGADGFGRLSAALTSHGLGHILDFVPNHMGVGRGDNPWWLDVLEWGRNSPYAAFFDIDWTPAKPELRGKVMLPILGNIYGEILEDGKLCLRFDREAGSFAVHYFEHVAPIGPRHYPRILNPAVERLRDAAADAETIDRLAGIAGGFGSLPSGEITLRRRHAVRGRADVLKRDLAGLVAEAPAVAAAIDETVAWFNGTPGEARSFMALHRLLEHQAYRLCYWRVAADEINYRRFFDINELAGLRVELPELFDRIHRLVLDLVADGKLGGLRIDHIDGLFDPRGYCLHLRERLREAAGNSSTYLVVEKILAVGESLPSDWPVDGTTGYDFMNEVLWLLVDPSGERRLTTAYHRFTGADRGFQGPLIASRRYVVESLLAGELQVLANELDRIAEENWLSRDFTLNTLRDALAEVAICFPVYRTYVTGRGAGEEDRRYIEEAVRAARRRSTVAPIAFDFIHEALTTDLVGRRGYLRGRVVRFAMGFQQFTAPVMAKSYEDTAFYRYHRLDALNEVGGDPRRFGISVAAFHDLCRERQANWPRSMLATMSHDAKRGEDVRARLAVLSEIPDQWWGAVRQWSRRNRRQKPIAGGYPAPVAEDEYLLYQTILGSWPVDFTGDAAPADEALADYRERLHGYMQKAVREAKLRSSWTEPDTDYEDGISRFIDRILDPQSGAEFLADFVPFQARIAAWGMVNGLAQTLLKLAGPGVPDTFQGSELWDLRLVDPDNRRPVDFDRRRTLLDGLARQFGGDGPAEAAALRDLLESWRDGRIKLFLVWKALQLRRARPGLFTEGEYRPLDVAGTAADHVCAFARVAGDHVAIVAAPRLVAGLTPETAGPPVGADVWGDTVVTVPADLRRRLRSALTGADVALTEGESGTGRLPAAVLFDVLPVALLAAP